MTSSEKRSVTLKDVAAAAGITAAAASMALSGRSRISAETVERVKAIAAELGYVPSSAGRSLRSQKAGAIALIVPNSARHVFGHSYFMHVLNGVTEAANDHDTSLLVSTSSTRTNGIAAYERVMRSGRVDGAIVTSAAIGDPNIQRLTQTGLPVVLIGNDPTLTDCPSVWIDDVEASRQITEHLITTHQRRRIVHVAGPLDHQTGVDRRDGFLRAVRANGLDDTAIVMEGNLSEASGYEAVASLLKAKQLPDGIVFANDDMAFGGLSALREAGVSVPEDVAVVGFDDFGQARWSWPGITTMRVPAEQVARIATDEIFARISGAEGVEDHVQLEANLIPRESCGCTRQPEPLPSD